MFFSPFPDAIANGFDRKFTSFRVEDYFRPNKMLTGLESVCDFGERNRGFATKSKEKHSHSPLFSIIRSKHEKEKVDYNKQLDRCFLFYVDKTRLGVITHFFKNHYLCKN